MAVPTLQRLLRAALVGVAGGGGDGGDVLGHGEGAAGGVLAS